ncbi:hypothetical protein DCAR_0310004 [Daucus carota subsp. sativus]|uniref:Uncharacterized protein n=1 Tax=Daucus carota subsp. sativus TaxID=79200 RepID=A0AAF0WKG6_DAUCS|nr:hypothetical protein DCAR_0310004 [Daucus carota subsp. sativus]
MDLGKKMNHGTQNCGSQDLENQLSSSNVWYTDEGQSQQPFLQFSLLLLQKHRFLISAMKKLLSVKTDKHTGNKLC